jgi:hypothetical protein
VVVELPTEVFSKFSNLLTSARWWPLNFDESHTLFNVLVLYNPELNNFFDCVKLFDVLARESVNNEFLINHLSSFASES